jgi:hypothetical protein
LDSSQNSTRLISESQSFTWRKYVPPKKWSLLYKPTRRHNPEDQCLHQM